MKKDNYYCARTLHYCDRREVSNLSPRDRSLASINRARIRRGARFPRRPPARTPVSRRRISREGREQEKASIGGKDDALGAPYRTRKGRDQRASFLARSQRESSCFQAGRRGADGAEWPWPPTADFSLVAAVALRGRSAKPVRYPRADNYLPRHVYSRIVFASRR